MIIERNNNGNFTAFQRFRSGSKAGVICEAPTFGEAINGAAELAFRAAVQPGLADFFQLPEEQECVK